MKYYVGKPRVKSDMEVTVNCEIHPALLSVGTMRKVHTKSRRKELQRWKKVGGMFTLSLGGRVPAESLEEN